MGGDTVKESITCFQSSDGYSLILEIQLINLFVEILSIIAIGIKLCGAVGMTWWAQGCQGFTTSALTGAAITRRSAPLSAGLPHIFIIHTILTRSPFSSYWRVASFLHGTPRLKTVLTLDFKLGPFNLTKKLKSNLTFISHLMCIYIFSP